MDILSFIFSLISLAVSSAFAIWTKMDNKKVRKETAELQKELEKSKQSFAKELEETKQQHEKSMLKLKEEIQQNNRYEIQKDKVISDYFGGAKSFLGDPDNPNTYSKFAEASSVIHRYLPGTYVNDINELTQMIDNIHNITIGYNDGSYQQRAELIDEAIEFHRQICNKLADLKRKN